MVLLKNDGALLPLDPTQDDRGDRPARRRPARHARPVVGHRAMTRTRSRCSPASRRRAPNTTFAQACTIADKEPPTTPPRTSAAGRRLRGRGRRRERGRPGRARARRDAAGMSGEAASRSDIDLPGKQQELIDAIKATGKPFVVVLFNGRPLTLRRSPRRRRRSSRPGSRASRPATPSPTSCSARSTRAASCPVSFPRSLGQVPIYYNHEPTGRPVRRRRPSTTRATATSPPATRCTRSGSA